MENKKNVQQNFLKRFFEL